MKIKAYVQMHFVEDNKADLMFINEVLEEIRHHPECSKVWQVSNRSPKLNKRIHGFLTTKPNATRYLPQRKKRQ